MINQIKLFDSVSVTTREIVLSLIISLKNFIDSDSNSFKRCIKSAQHKTLKELNIY